MGGVHFWGLLIAAPFIGSFLGVLVARLPHRRPIIFSRSQCEACGHTLGPRDLIPLASWLTTFGRCRYCDAAIGWLLPAIEVAAILVVVWGASATSGPILAATCVFGWTLLALGLIDAKYFLLPDVLCGVLALGGVIVTLFLMPQALADHLIGGVAGALFFIVLALSYRALRGRDGLGLGDAKLMGAIGLWLGWQALPSLVLFAAIIGLLYALGLSLIGRSLSLSARLPLGTFLAAAAWVVWLYGPLLPGYS